MSTDSFFAGQLAAAEAAGNLRRLPRILHDGRYAVVDGRRMLNLSSNDYLGIASDPGMPLMRDFLQGTAAACPSQDTCSPMPEDILLGSASSRLLTGTFDVHEAVERMLCRLSGRQAALVFSSGYHMNIGILPAVCDASTLILADKLVHASIIDGIRLSAGKCVRFRHQDIDQLESLVEKYHLAGLKKRYPGVMLYVDEAHAVGVRGETGMGLAQELGVAEEIDFLCGTFGKALASVGAYVLCDSDIREFLVNRMRSFIFTTALPPLNMLWTLRVLQCLAGMGDRRRLLSRNASKLRSALASAGLPCPSASHIIPVMAGDSHRAASLAASMQKEGFYLLPIRPPTVPEGTSRLRISLTAALSNEDTDALSAALLKAVL